MNILMTSISTIRCALSRFSFVKYKVITKIHINGKLIGSPNLVVESGKKIGIVINRMYDYLVTVNPINENLISISQDLSTRGKNLVPSPPPIVTMLGKETSIQVNHYKYTVLITSAAPYCSGFYQN